MAQTQRVVREYVQRGHIERTLQAMPIAAKRLRVAAYCRVSTDDEEQLNSYKSQVEYYTAFIKSKPEWEYVDTYADEGITGTSARKRKEFQRLIRDALDGRIDLILCKSVSRFARNTIDSLSTVRDLREKNVKIYFEKENIDSLDPKCDMILSIYSSLAEEESRSISTNVRWAHNKRVERGEVVFNFKNLYGYTQDEEKNVSTVEHEAEVVRDIYHKYLIGYSIAEICRDLTARGIKSRMGNRWHFSTVETMLQNEKYMGHVVLRKTYQRDFLAEKRVKNTGQAPQKIVENNHPAIIDSATWNAVQAEMERRGNIRTSEETGKGRYDMRYVFSGIIECGDCGSTFRRHSHSRRNGKIDRVWTCKEHIRGIKYCKQLSVREDILEEAFVRTFNGLLTDRSRALKAVEDSVVEAMFEAGDGTGTAEEIAEIDAEIERLQAQMIEINKQRARREIDGAAYNERTKEVKEKLDALFEKRDDLEEAQSAGALSMARRQIISGLLESEREQTEFDKDVFAKLIEAVRVYSRDDITFIFKDGTEVKADLGTAEQQ
jgi:DNA invertase Pin-like site-specific DNA recombinase